MLRLIYLSVLHGHKVSNCVIFNNKVISFLYCFLAAYICYTPCKDAQYGADYVILSTGYWHSDRLSISRHQL
jgi:hypothetical protein